MYLGGSLALGAFDPETSDVDFLVVTEGEVTEELGKRLRAAHVRITAGESTGAKKRGGRDGARETLRTRGRSRQRCAYVGVGGGFSVGGYSNDWIVELHVVRERGMVVAGPDPK